MYSQDLTDVATGPVQVTCGAKMPTDTSSLLSPPMNGSAAYMKGLEDRGGIVSRA